MLFIMSNNKKNSIHVLLDFSQINAVRNLQDENIVSKTTRVNVIFM